MPMTHEEMTARAIAVSDLCHAAEKQAYASLAATMELGSKMMEFCADAGESPISSRKTIADIKSSIDNGFTALEKVGSAHVRAEHKIKEMGDFPPLCPKQRDEGATVSHLREVA